MLKDKVLMELNRIQPHHVEGHICIDLTDPVTGKVKQRTEGKNIAFPALVYGCAGNSNSSGGWATDMNTSFLFLTDSTTTIDTSLPLILGQVVGYGKPSAGSSGNYRGAYSAANQVLADRTIDSIRWKFQYDFTASQANGTIGTIGLSDSQFYTPNRRCSSRPFLVGGAVNYGQYTNDGRYAYWCTVAGVITKYDCLLGTSETIDVSATVGTTGSYKTIAYDPVNKRYGVYVCNSTTSLIRLYIFSDDTFSTLLSTHSPSNILYSNNNPLYIYGNFLFNVMGTTISYADFINNSAYSTITPSTNPATITEAGASAFALNYGTTAYNKYLFCGWSPANYRSCAAVIDMSSFTQIGHGAAQYFTGNTKGPIVRNPFYDDVFVLSTADKGAYLADFGATAMKKLDAPVVKTTANGMTATYELEVFW